ncbi:hypothetical protein GIB67_027555 [Kingdonia uniflora]|uniref:Uncharacterized protein n=1 Tax=Kingdonia uniflora TaxID=39325 RepID=A0A7J7NKR4_9MAGN|nr:hypothetical protein GIB67_027555 [Kingdonia uniflora]
MADVPKLLYIVVSDDNGEKSKGSLVESFRYTRPVLQSTLQLMGCKARHAFKISRRVFEVIRREYPANASSPKGLNTSGNMGSDDFLGKLEVDNHLILEKDENSSSKPFELYKMRTTIVVSREKFLDVVCDALSDYKYVSPNQKADLILACRIRERKESVTVLLCGTSGCGKSTLSALLGSRLGITTVISTDSIRHMMRSFVDEKQNPLLWASTYHAGEFLDPVAVAEAKSKRKAKKLAPVSPTLTIDEVSNGYQNGRSSTRSPESGSSPTELIGTKQMAVEGFKAQSEMVIDSLDRLITSWEERKESVVVEGVHLSLNFVRKGSSRHLMALLNTDGSVAKAWPVDSNDNGKPISVHGSERSIGNPMYGPLQIGKAEPVNLQFGNFGISAFPNDTGGTSHAGSIDESRADGSQDTETGSRYYSSCCSSPRMSEGHSKERKEELLVSGSDEEADDIHEADTDEDLTDEENKRIDDEMEGSVDEESTKSDEEYDDLAMRDELENGYSTDDENDLQVVPISEDPIPKNGSTEKYQENLNLFLKTNNGPLCSYPSMQLEKNQQRASGTRMRRRSLSIPAAVGKHGTLLNGPILSGAPYIM